MIAVVLLVACAVVACVGWAVSVRAARRQLRYLETRQRHGAKREQDRLEGVVVARTAQLDRRNAEMRLIFDHVEQGLLTVNVDGTIASGHSVSTWPEAGPAPNSGSCAATLSGEFV